MLFRSEQNITDTRKRLTETQTQVEAPFEYADKLASLAQRQQEIMEALDLTKNEAGTQTQAEASDDDQVAEAESVLSSAGVES